jgi:hypothetical protein
MNLYIKNTTNEDVILIYSISNDLLVEGEYEKTFNSILKRDEIIPVLFSWNQLYNRGVKQEDYQKKETFLNIFENIDIINSEGIITQKDVDNFNITYIRKYPASHIFIIEIIK